MVHTHSIRKLLLFIYYFKEKRKRRERREREERGEGERERGERGGRGEEEERKRRKKERKKELGESLLHQKQSPPQLTFSLLHTHLEKKKRERRD